MARPFATFATFVCSLATVFSSVLIASPTSAQESSPASRPNIVYILADDLGYADCGFNGGTQIKTPNLDKLAGEGTVLESFYVQPVCSPTRAALMTGRYPIRHGLQVGVIRPNAEFGLPLEERMLSVALQEVGYTTAITGKWHLGSFDPQYWPHSRGFDHSHGHLFGALDYFTHIRNQKLDWYRNGEQLDQPGYTTQLVGEEAVKFVKEQSGEKPFFLYVPFNAVHTPLQVPDHYREPYMDLPEQRSKLAGMLAAMDESVGKIVDAVEEQGLRDSTLFIFSSDNGGFRPRRVTDNGPLRAGKGTLYEGGVRVAAFATWDGHIAAGERNDEPVHIVDWFPTLLTLAGGSLEQPKKLDGLDIWPTLTSGKPSPHEEILLNSTPNNGAIRVGNWKLKRNRNQPPELYNLAEDLGEQNNVAEANPEVVKDLQTRLDRYAAEALPPKNQQN